MTIYLWLPKREDADRARSLGLIERDYHDQVAAVHGVASSLDGEEHDVEVIVTSVDEMLAALAELGAANDPRGRAAAAGLLASRRG